MIYLLDWKDFEPIIENKGYIKMKGFKLKANIGEIIYNKLQLAAQKNEFIHTQWLRCIGKTYELIRFARRNNYVVLHPQANEIKEKYKYNFIYEPNINKLRGIDNLNVVIDEGIKNIKELKDAGFNIITGYYTPKEENNKSFSELVIDNLKNEIESLTFKIQKVRENHDFGTYKNLILAYKEVLNLIIDMEKHGVNIN